MGSIWWSSNKHAGHQRLQSASLVSTTPGILSHHGWKELTPSVKNVKTRQQLCGKTLLNSAKLLHSASGNQCCWVTLSGDSLRRKSVNTSCWGAQSFPDSFPFCVTSSFAIIFISKKDCVRFLKLSQIEFFYSQPKEFLTTVEEVVGETKWWRDLANRLPQVIPIKGK